MGDLMIRQRIVTLALGMLLPVAMLNAAKANHNQPMQKQPMQKGQQKKGGMARKKPAAAMATKLTPAEIAQTKMEAQAAIKANNPAGLVDPVNTMPMQTAQLLGPVMAAQVLQQPGLTPQATAALQAVVAQGSAAMTPAATTSGMPGAISMPAAMTPPGIAAASPSAPATAAPATIAPAIPATTTPTTAPQGSMQGVDFAGGIIQGDQLGGGITF